MNFQEQIEYIFGDVTDTLTIYDNNTSEGEDLLVGSVDAAVKAAETVADPWIVTEMGSKVYAICGDFPEEAATLVYSTIDHDYVHVFVLKDPVDLADLADTDSTVVPLAGPWWAVDVVTDKLYTLEELDTLEKGDANDTTNDMAPEGVEDAELVETVARETRSGDDGSVGTTGASAEADEPAQSDDAVSGGNPDGGSSDGVAAEVGTPGADGEPAAQNFLNDAVVLGEPTPELEALYNQNFTFMTGDLYGARDRRNTQDGQWQAADIPLMSWLYGEDKTASAAEWGLTRHPEGKVKEGASLVLASAIDGARTDSAIESIYAIVLDVDGGASLKDTVDKLVDKKIFSIVYTTFSHRSTITTLKHDDIVKKLKLDGSPSLAQVKEYMGTHLPDKFDADFISQVTIKESNKQTATGIKVILDTPPIDKFRVIIPLQEPVRLSTLGPTVSAWKEAWENLVCGVAVNMLDVNFDTASCDVNRLFYTPRHPKGRDDWESYLIQGTPLRVEEIEPYSKAEFVRGRKSGNDPFAVAGGGDTEKNKRAYMPSGESLNKWHTDVGKERFQITDVLTTFCEDKIRVAGNEKEGAVHVECPFEHEHTDEGGTACMAVNALDSESGFWTWFCHHDSCAGRHKLEFLEEALKENWFEESVLKDDEFVMPPEDGDVPDSAPPAETAFEGTSNRTPVERCADFDNTSTEADIQEFLEELFSENVDKTIRNAVTEALASTTLLGKVDIKPMWQALIVERVREERDTARQDAASFDGTIAYNMVDIQEVWDYGLNRMEKSNDKKAHLFHYMGVLSRVREDEKGIPRIDMLTEDQFAYELNNISTYAQVTVSDGSESSRNISAPRDVVKHLYHIDLSTFPRLRGITTSPTFASDGSMIVKPGFHSTSGIMYIPDHKTSIPPVSLKPTAEEIEKAKLLLIDDVFGDFPVGGFVNYQELISESMGPKGVPAMTTLIGMLLLFFCRDLIDGPTPGHLFTKPTPATGASLITELCGIIGMGTPIGATTLPKTDEEMKKTLLAQMITGVPMIVFDNIDSNVNSGELASALTAPAISGRVLGGSKIANVDIRTIWAFTGNNVQISGELLRRLVLVDLNAWTDKPGDRVPRNPDIAAWVKDNRGELVWACLTLIQNYVAKGQVPYRDKTLASFGDWAKVIGGITRDAGLNGFMGNRELLQDIADDESDADINQLVEVWWDFHHNKKVHVNATDEPQSLAPLAMAQSVELPVRKARNADGDMEYNSRSFGALLRRYRGRVYALSDGTKVTMLRDDMRDSKGHAWYLEAVKQDA